MRVEKYTQKKHTTRCPSICNSQLWLGREKKEKKLRIKSGIN
jgi:hypothetical protein